MVPAHSHKVSRVSWYSGSRRLHHSFAYGAFTLFGRSSQTVLLDFCMTFAVRTPKRTRFGLGASVWALPVPLAATPGIILYFLFLRLLRCFSSPGSLPHAMDSRKDDWSLSSRVSPFRNPWIIAHLQLPAAYRSLSRLSSALSAKASALRSSCFTALVSR